MYCTYEVTKALSWKRDHLAQGYSVGGTEGVYVQHAKAARSLVSPDQIFFERALRAHRRAQKN